MPTTLVEASLSFLPSKLRALPNLPVVHDGAESPTPSMPVFPLPLVSYALVPVFSSIFHSITGALHVAVSPGTQYSRVEELSGLVPPTPVDREPKEIAFPPLYSTFTWSGVRPPE